MLTQDLKSNTMMSSSTIISFLWHQESRVSLLARFIRYIELRTPIDPKDLITFLEANHNLMVFADAESKRPIRQLANEFGVEFEGAVSDIICGIINCLGLRGQRL